MSRDRSLPTVMSAVRHRSEPVWMAGALGVLTHLAADTARAAVVLSYESYHSAQWEQTSEVPSLTEDNARWFYSARLITDDGLATLGANVQAAGGGTLNLSETVFGQWDATSGYYATKSALLADWPGGVPHLFSITDGSLAGETGAINHPNVLPFPTTIPTFRNYSTFGTMDAAAATFEWSLWNTPPAEPSAAFLLIRSGSALVHAVSLSLTDTQHTVPSGVLVPGTQYSVELVFSSRVGSGLGNWNGDGVEGLAGYDYRTVAQFATLVPEPEDWAALTGLLCVLAAAWKHRAKRPSA